MEGGVERSGQAGTRDRDSCHFSRRTEHGGKVVIISGIASVSGGATAMLFLAPRGFCHSAGRRERSGGGGRKGERER